MLYYIRIHSSIPSNSGRRLAETIIVEFRLHSREHENLDQLVEIFGNSKIVTQINFLFFRQVMYIFGRIMSNTENTFCLYKTEHKLLSNLV